MKGIDPNTVPLPDPEPPLEPPEVEVPAPRPGRIIDRKQPLWQTVTLLAIPWWAQQFLQLAVNLSDAYLAGNLLALSPEQNVAGQAAQTNGIYLQWFIGNFSVLVSVGATALVARFVGARDHDGAIRAANQSLVLAALFGVTGSVLGLVFVHELCWLLQLRGDAASMAADYLRPTFYGLTFQMLAAVAIACLIGAGDTVTGMGVMSAVAIINLPLAWGFFKGWWPLPELGFVGISMGTAVAQSLGCLALLAVLARGRAGLHLRVADLWPDPRMMWRLLRVSVPAGVDSISYGLGQLWFLSIVNPLGTVASAAHGIALRWEALGYMSGGAFGVATMTLVGQNLGARRPDQAARSGWTAFALACGTMSAMGVIFFVLARPMFEVFCPKLEQQLVVDTGVPVLRLIAWAMPPLASCIVFTGALRGAGDTRVPVLFTWLGFFGVRIPLAYWLTTQTSLGLLGAWIAMCADLLVRGVVLLWRFASGGWKWIRV